MLNPLARARGLGSAKQGTGHWFVQRATAVALIFLLGWGVYAAVALAGTDHAEARAFVARPLNAALLLLLLVSLFWHAMLGLQVVIEDYVHHPLTEWLLHFLTRAAAWLGMALGAVHLLKIALGG
ncbi:MAG: succinate dehydrogenase, hydrophobic membrane anchor protein [Xanthomonadales bacterium]|nr:succinate dehydrogenase, hydrophobic membrane anchor protein [Xanthomonadales bacterium]